MKKVSVTDKYTYDGKEMTEREREIHIAAMGNGQYKEWLVWMMYGLGIITGVYLGIVITLEF